MNKDFERRFFSCEMRADPGEEGEEGACATRIVGHGAVFNQRSENLGGFREVIAPGAFDEVLGDDVRGLFNHDSNFVLGRTTANTLELSVDDAGLRYDIIPPDTQTIRDLVLAPMARGDIDRSSFTFTVVRDGESWEEDDEGVVVRTIHRVKRLYDVGPVTFPAYPTADAAKRSLEQWQQARDEGLIQRALRQREARERLLTLINA